MLLRHDRTDADCLADERDWPGVVTFFGGDGAGTLIAPAWALTAGHTAANIPAGHSVPVGGRRHRIDRVVLFPEPATAPGEPHDIALVRLAEPAEGVPCLPLHEGGDETGREVVLLGRGDFGDGLAGSRGADGRLRRATNIIDDADDHWLRFRFDAPPGGTWLEGVSGIGDSGGPALIRGDGGALSVAGVSSWQEHGDGPYGRYGAVEHYVRVSHYLSWIGLVLRS